MSNLLSPTETPSTLMESDSQRPKLLCPRGRRLPLENVLDSLEYRRGFVEALRGELVASVYDVDQAMVADLFDKLDTATTAMKWDRALHGHISPYLDRTEAEYAARRAEPLLTLFHCLRGGYRMVYWATRGLLPARVAITGQLVAVFPGLEQQIAARYATLMAIEKPVDEDQRDMIESVAALLGSTRDDVTVLEPLLTRWRTLSVSDVLRFLGNMNLTNDQAAIFAQLVTDHWSMSKALAAAKSLA